MTDKEKILAEIQKRIEFQKTCIKNDYRLTGRAEEEIIFEYQKLINFINSFPKESVSEKKCMYSKDTYTDEDRKVLCDDCKEECKYASNIPPVFDEGYWERLGEKPVSEDLEEAVNAYIGYAPEVDESSSTYGKRQAFKIGANWQKQQMMTKAVDGFVIEDIEEGNGDFLLSAEYLSKDMGLKDRQKVKVIVIKEN